MKDKIVLVFIATAWISSCKQGWKLTPQSVDTEISNSSNNVQKDKDIYTKYEYADTQGGSLIILNSFPRGGIKYTAPDGEEYYCAVFFNRIINDTGNPLELKINFPADLYAFPSLPGRYFRLLLPSDTMTLDKAPLSNYGLVYLESFLDNNRHKSFTMERTIKPKESSGFYVVKINIKPESGWEGGSGSTRAEFIIKAQNVYYRIKNDGSKNNSQSSEIEIHCGSINLNDLSAKK